MPLSTPSNQPPDWYHGDWVDFSKKTGPMNSSTTSPTPKPGSVDFKQMGKDIAVDAATQLPLALIPEAGAARTALRAGGSLLSGFMADRALNSGDKNEDSVDSLMNAGLNTGLSMAVPGMIENKVGFKAPSVQGTGVSAPILKLWNLLNPGNYSVQPRMMVRPGASQAVPANMGNILKDVLTQKGMPQGVRMRAAGIPADVLNQIVKNLTGFGANVGVDTTLNKPTQ